MDKNLLNYTIRLGDNCLVLGQRMSMWCSNGPTLEEDIALANISLDLFGQATAFATQNLYVGAPLNDRVASNRGSVYQFRKNANDKSWVTLATQPNVVDVNKIQKSFGYDKTNNELMPSSFAGTISLNESPIIMHFVKSIS